MTVDHADHDEVAQTLGEHFRRDAHQIVLQLGEAPGAAAEIPDDVRGPSAPEEAHTEFQRTGGRGWLTLLLRRGTMSGGVVVTGESGSRNEKHFLGRARSP